MPLPSMWPFVIERIAWPIAFVLAYPTALVTSRILGPRRTAETATTALDNHLRTLEMTRAITAARGGGGGPPGPGLAFLLKAAWCGALFVFVDECAGLDILHSVLGIDFLPWTPLQRRLRENRREWRRARRSGDGDVVRETFFRLQRERFDLMGVWYEEEGMKAPAAAGNDVREGGTAAPAAAAAAAAAGLLDPADVRVFFIRRGSDVVGVYIAFNVDSNELGVLGKAEKTTRWILTQQAESRRAGGKLDKSCKVERVFRNGSEGEYLLRLSRDGDGGGSTLADAWDRREKVL